MKYVQIVGVSLGLLTFVAALVILLAPSAAKADDLICKWVVGPDELLYCRPNSPTSCQPNSTHPYRHCDPVTCDCVEGNQ